MTDKTEWLAWACLDWTGVQVWTGEWLRSSHSPSIVESGHLGRSSSHFSQAAASFGRLGATGWGELTEPLDQQPSGIGSSLTGHKAPSSYQSPSWEEVFFFPCTPCWRGTGGRDWGLGGRLGPGLRLGTTQSMYFSTVLFCLQATWI